MNQVQELNLKNSVAIFGSARIDERHIHYVACRNLAKHLCGEGWNILSGGGPGIMEAANRGASEAEEPRGVSVGIKIHIPEETTDHEEQYHDVTLHFDKFYARQSTLVYNADLYVAFFGGIGTLFEICEVITLMQTGFLPKSTIHLYGTEHWTPFMQQMVQMAKSGACRAEDLDLIKLTDRVGVIARYAETRLEK